MVACHFPDREPFAFRFIKPDNGGEHLFLSELALEKAVSQLPQRFSSGIRHLPVGCSI
jgi:hypothetical protein